MSSIDAAFIEASNCFDFANNIWLSRQKERYEDAKRAFDIGMKIYNEHFAEKSACAEEEFEF